MWIKIMKFMKRNKDGERKTAPGLIEPRVGISFNDKSTNLVNQKIMHKDWLGNDGFFYAILQKK